MKAMNIKKIVALVLCVVQIEVIILGLTPFIHAKAETNEQSNGINLESESAILMEASTGMIIYEKDADKSLAPASITKIMTLILIFDAINEGKIYLTDEVTVSEHAASMGGSQVYLEAGETQNVDTMIKCISMASANDACVAMAEFISGTEEAFVVQMNERAKGLEMKNTNFVNCCGLDVDNHHSSAKDIAIMSKELITKYPKIHDYSTVWMDTIVHSTRRGDSEFGLTNTNKLIKQYEWATGLKTGSTSKAGCCLSATAKKNGIDLIAVVMAAPNSKTRFSEAINLLNYGFSNCYIYTDENPIELQNVEISGGVKNTVGCEYQKTFSYLFMNKVDNDKIMREVVYDTGLVAPIDKGTQVGHVTYSIEGQTLGEVPIVTTEDIGKATFWDMVKKVAFFMVGGEKIAEV